MDALKKEEIYTVDDNYALPDGERAELIDGKIYYMAPPNRTHQRLLLSLSRIIADYIDSKNGDCEINIAPFAVFLNKNTAVDRKHLGNKIQMLFYYRTDRHGCS